MLGKRARQIRRTTSMSQLGPRSIPPLESFGERTSSANRSHENRQFPPVEVLDDEPMAEESSGDCEMLQNGSSVMMEDDAPEQSMVVDLSINENSTSNRSSRRYLVAPFGSPVAAGIHARPEPAEWIRPIDFLDICFYCKRRLGHGRDIFMYRGDRAFCSNECRDNQIASDEPRETCAVTAVKRGGAASTVNSTSNKTETAAAA